MVIERDNAVNIFADLAIVISGWRYGSKKIEKLLQHELGYSLTTAKNTTDRVLDKCRLEFAVSGSDHDRFTRLSAALGAIVIADEQSLKAENK